MNPSCSFLHPRYRPAACAGRGARFVQAVAGFMLFCLVWLAAGVAEAQTYDYGDYSGFSSAYSTRNSTIRLGALVDAESSAQTNSTATGDDINGSDDEDGVIVPATMVRGQPTSMVVNVTNTSNSTVYLNAWVDYNRNGSLSDSGEQIASNVTIARNSNGANRTLSFTVPSGASVGTAGVRVRITSNSSPGPTGLDGRGETEDYLTTISDPLDYGDYAPFPSASSIVNSTLRIGATVDSETADLGNADATGDDSDGSDDEDGVVLPTSIQRGEAGSLKVTVSNSRGSTAYLSAWIDWNGNGSLSDSGEQIASNVTVSNGTSNSTRTLNFTAPANAKLGESGVRVRLTSGTSPGPDGQDGYGEVEDYMVTVGSNLSVGNLVWNDANDNGRFDEGESGINNVLVELWSPGADNAIGGTGSNADTKLASTNTASGGIYSFSNLSAGSYFVKVPTPPLSRVSSVVAAGDNGVDNDNNGTQPGGSATSVYSTVFQLAAGTEPGTGGGGNQELTIDFGFVANVGSPFVCDNRFYIMQNVETSSGSGNWDTTLNYIDEDQQLVPIFIFTGKKLNGLVSYAGYLYCVDQNAGHLYRINSVGTLVDMGEPPGLPNGNDGQWGGATALTSGLMILNRYTFSNARTTLYTIDLGSASLVGSPVTTRYSSSGSYTSGNFGDIVWDPLTDKIYGYNTNDSSNLGLFEINTTTGYCTRVASSYLSTFGSLTIDANGLAYGYGSQSSSTSQDTLYVFNRTNGVLNGSMTAVGSGPVVTNSDGAACPGAPPSMKIGSHVWQDANNNGLKDAGEAGLSGVPMQLFLGGENPATAQPSATTVTGAGGSYAFDNLSPGQYFVYIPVPPAGHPLSSTNTDTADNSQDNDDNGIQTAQGQPTRSPLISLSPTQESTTDGDNDSNTDMTVDFGFLACPAVTISGVPPAATVARAYSHTFSASGGTGAPYTWSVVSGSLPSGLTLSAAGVLSGTPAASNGSGVTVGIQAADATGCAGTASFTVVVLPHLDFGDYASFPSASSVADGTLRIGSLVDAEAAENLNATATGDDENGVDDEDGVAVPAWLERGRTVSVPVTVTNTSGSTAYLNVWVDFNRNGSPSDSGEQVVSNLTVATGTVDAVRTVSFTVPLAASVGSSAMRVRLTSVSSPGVNGTDGTGEVEDHAVQIAVAQQDYGDFSGFASASALGDGALRMGDLVDQEATATSNATATGDDMTGVDDEDGAAVPAGLEVGTQVTIPVQVTNNTGSNAWLHAWIDFNNDGTLNNSLVSAGGERLEPARIIGTAARGSILREWWTGIGGTAVADLTSNAAYPNSPTGSDQRTSFESPTDWADSMGQRMRGWLYPAVTGTYTFWVAGDDESQLFLSSDASAANATLIANVPGWTSPRQWYTYTQQRSVAVTLEAGKAYYIEALMKEGGGGDNLSVAWERTGTGTGPVVIEGQFLSPFTSSGPVFATQDITFTVPANASVGTGRGVRFRVSESQTTGPTGASVQGEVEDYVTEIQPPSKDFGDYASFALASNKISANLRLGATVDAEISATINATATGDDITGTDDEDAVNFPSMTAGQPVSLPVPVTNLTATTAYLNAWIDFNNDGDMLDAGEQVATNVAVPAGTNNQTLTLEFTVPTDAVTAATNVGARFRLTAEPSPGSVGQSDVLGEVEDYAVVILAPITDFGDWSRAATVSNTADSRLRLGATVDAEYAATTDLNATGDDITGVDDEDGVTITALVAGGPGSLTINRTNTTGAAGYVNAWIDFNNNGSFGDTGELVLSNSAVATGTSNANQVANFTVPATAVTGTPLGVRVRITASTNPGFSGAGGIGEVEDYVITVAAPVTDFGDFSGFGSASSVRTDGLLLGSLIDTEYAATANATATGDDSTGVDDEDGVTFPAMTAGAPATLQTVVTNTSGSSAYLNVWIDFNGNGVLTDPGEQVCSDVIVANGSSAANRNISYTVPATSLTGVNLGARVRLTTTAGAASTGAVGGGEVEDYIVTVAAPTTDYGDFSGFADASQGVSPSLRMGATVDAEFASTRNAMATGDDVTGIDDEDGVVLPALIAGGPASIIVTATNTTGALGYLNAWIDFNSNGVLTDPGEQVAVNRNVVTGTTDGSYTLTFTVPAGAVTGTPVGARFRLSAPISPGPVGNNAAVGEVEDYVVTIAAPTTDFGDHANLGSASSTVDTRLRMGALVDAEYAATTNAAATGDDITGADDEDGVALPSLSAGSAFTIPVTVTNTRGGGAFLNAWIDYNNNGSLADAGEQIATNVAVADGTNNAVINVTGTVPFSATTGVNLAVRFRLTSGASPGSVGSSGTGEVEDYVVNIIAPTQDYGDWSRAPEAANGVTANLKLGALVDAEMTSMANADASGDDNSNLDDEDGVTLPAMTAGQSLSIPVVLTNTTGATAYLNVWMDFNNNGSLADAGEQVVVNRPVANGTNGATVNVPVSIPATAVTGELIGMRFRLTAQSSPGIGGVSTVVGEVEDYTATLLAPVTDFGDHSALGSASSVVRPGLRMGALVDTEFSATANATATGDDTTGVDDEDGVLLPAFTAGGPATIPVTVTNTTGAPAYLNVWMDFNNNGSLTDAGELVAANVAVPAGSNNAVINVQMTVPAEAVTGTPLPVRFRLVDVLDAPAIGAAGNGEVEDYAATVALPPTDFGDWSRVPDAFSTADNRLRLGALVDTEFVSTRNATATGDDNTGVDDEDGVVLPQLIAGGPAVLPVTVTNTAGAPAYLNVWMDFNNNGSFADAGEQVAADLVVASGQNNALLNVNLTVPANAVTGSTMGIRMRLTDVTGTQATGGSGIGEVEDYTTIVAVPTTDFGDWSGAADAWSTASSDLRLGALADTEYAATRNAAASGDDVTGSDDEDGVVLPASLNLGAGGTLTATLTNNTSSTAYLNAWIDFNGNGSFTDGGEQIVSNTTVSSGSNGVNRSFNFTTPSNAKPGIQGVRVRLSSVQNPGPTGAGGTGEVEDYVILINCPQLSLSPSSLTVPVIGQNYQVNFNSNGGTGPYTFLVTSGSLPNGLVLNSNGNLSGIATSTTPASFVLTVSDVNGCSVTGNYTTTPVCPAIPLSPSSFQNPVVGQFYSQTINASGGTAPYVFTIESGTLPPGLALSSSGTVSGTVTQAGTVNVVLRATDFYGCSSSQSYTVTPGCPAVSLSPSSMPAPVTGTAYTQTFTASGGQAPYTFTLSSGALPAGLTLSSSGVVSGTPVSSASAVFQIRVTDSRGCTGSRAFSVTPSCAPVAIQTAALANGYLQTAYSSTLEAASGTAPYTWSLSSGQLPAGLSLSTAGTLSGAPTVQGVYTFGVRAQDASGCAAVRTLTLTVKGMSLGNRIWLDNNNNGLQEAGENGVAGAVVQLFQPGTDNAVGGTGSAADAQVGASMTTGADGLYQFTGLAPGRYFVKVVAPYGYTHSGGTPVIVDNQMDGNNDGSQPGGIGTPLFSPVVLLQPGTESTADGDSDADTDLTVDFGLWAPLAVGNRVFFDANDDGRMNANEGVRYAFVQLFRAGANVATDTPVNAALTDENGRYLMTDIDPGSYFLHLAAIQFEQGGVLEWMKPMPQVLPGDDDVGQDLLYNNDPAVNGASTAVFTLIPGALAAGSAESGSDGVADDQGIDANCDLTLDLGLTCLDCFVDTVAPPPAPAPAAMLMRNGAELADTDVAAVSAAGSRTTYALWAASRGVEEGPLGNTDGDLYANLLEYALGTDPSNGASGAGQFVLETDSFTGAVNARLKTPAVSLPDVTLNLEVSTDGRSWTAAGMQAEAAFDAEGERTQLFVGVDSLSPALRGASRGWVRVKAVLDADLNGVPEAEALTPVWIYSREAFAQGTRSFSMPLDQAELYAGPVSELAADGSLALQSAIPPAMASASPVLALEVLDGAAAGWRGGVSRVDGRAVWLQAAVPTGLVPGDRVAVRPAWTLNHLFPAELFATGGDADSADRVLFYDPAARAFAVAWLAVNGWRSDSSGPDANLYLPEGAAVLVQARAQPVNVTYVGQQPATVWQPLPSRASTRLMGSRRADDVSPLSLGLTASAGFVPAADASQSVRLRLWKADSAAAPAGGVEAGYDSYIYSSSLSTQGGWMQEGVPAPYDCSREPLLRAFRGFFLVEP